MSRAGGTNAHQRSNPPGPAGTRILDDTGTVVASSPTSLGMWADDSRHLCHVQLSAGGTALALDIADLVPGRGITHSRVMLSGANGSWPATLLGCSLRSDRVVLFGGLTAGLRATSFADIVQLSTGRVVLHLDLGLRGLTQPIVSPDGRYLAVNRAASSASGGKPVVDILDLGSGQVVTHQNGVAVGFSGDGRLLALDTGLTAGEGPASIVRWQTGQTTWTGTQSGLRMGDVRWVPDGGGMALTEWHAGVVPDVVLIRGDGSARTIARHAMLLSVGTLGTNG